MEQSTHFRIISLPLSALCVALCWVFFTREMYFYNLGFGTVASLNLFPLICWTIGLTVGYLIVSYVLSRIAVRRILLQLVIVFFLYAVVIIFLETFAYHAIGVKNIGTSYYTGLPLCDCLHAPLWMQAGYFLLGPIHWLLVRCSRKVMTGRRSAV